MGFRKNLKRLTERIFNKDGRPQIGHIHHADAQTIKDMYENSAPVFFLSTGRCGTKFLSELFLNHPAVIAHHEAHPNLQFFCNYSYHHQDKPEILRQMVDAARMELVLAAKIQNKTYLEANQCMVYYAPVISQLYKKAKFIHLVRHPGDFARSAIMKGWYVNDSIWEIGRIKPADQNFWQSLTHIEKIGWLWHETNQFIEAFGEGLNDSDRFLRVSFEEIVKTSAAIHQLTDFMGLERFAPRFLERFRGKKINRLEIARNEPPNMVKLDDFPAFNKWDDEMKNQLLRFTQTLAEKYGYCIK